MADRRIPVPRRTVIPSDLCSEIQLNSFRPARCIRLLYEYNNYHFARIVHKLGINRECYKQVVSYLKGEGTNEWRRKVATTNAFLDFGQLIITMSENEDYFRWLFSIKAAPRRVLLSQGVLTWEAYEEWVEDMEDAEVVTLFSDVALALSYNK